MFTRYASACLLATALTAAPALAQTSTGNTGGAAQNPPAGGAMAGGQQGNVTTQQFVRDAAISNMFEIQSSRLAEQKTQDQQVRNFAQRMIQDHTQASQQMQSAANGQNIPTSLDAPHQRMLQQLQGENDGAFVRDYVQMQRTGHEQTVALFQSYAQNGDNQQLKQLAQQLLPTLREHLQMVQQINVSNAGGNQGGGNQQQAAGAGARAGGGNVPYLRAESQGTWRASKVIGLNVYNQQNEKIGDINEVLFDRNGRVEGVVIGIGGFLGIGEHNVAVPYSALQWSMQPVGGSRAGGNAAGGNAGVGNTGGGNRAAGNTVAGNTGGSASANASGNTAGASSTNPAGNTNATTAYGGNNGMGNGRNPTVAYPDHAVLPNASKDQLRNAPQFAYGQGPR